MKCLRYILDHTKIACGDLFLNATLLAPTACSHNLIARTSVHNAHHADYQIAQITNVVSDNQPYEYLLAL